MMKNVKIALVLASSLLGCGAPDGAIDETLAEESAPLTDAPFTLRNYQTGLCMGVKGGTPTPGTRLITWPCDQSANQTWTKGPPYVSDPAFHQLKNSVAVNRCLHGLGSGNGAEAMIYTCGLAPYDVWKPIYAGNDLNGHECYRFAQKAGQRVLGVKNGNTAPGTPIILWDDFNNQFLHPNQLWCVY
jgi:hypothetical protein